MSVTETYTGAVTSALVQKEATYGTDVGSWAATDTMGILSTEVSATVRNTLTRGHVIGNRGTQYVVAGKADVTGSISGIFQTGKLVAYALGTDAVTGADPYTHTISPNLASAIPSFTMQITRGVSANKVVESYLGCKVSGFRLNATLDAPLEMSADFQAKTVSSIENTGAQAITPDTDDVQPPSVGYLQMPSGTALEQVQSFELNCQNNLKDVYGIGARVKAGLFGQEFTTDFRASVAFTDFGDTENLKIITNAYGDTASPYTLSDTADLTADTLQWKFTNSGATTAERSITCNITGYKMDELTVPTRTGDVTILDFSGQAATLTSIVTVDQNTPSFTA